MKAWRQEIFQIIAQAINLFPFTWTVFSPLERNPTRISPSKSSVNWKNNWLRHSHLEPIHPFHSYERIVSLRINLFQARLTLPIRSRRKIRSPWKDKLALSIFRKFSRFKASSQWLDGDHRGRRGIILQQTKGFLESSPKVIQFPQNDPQELTRINRDDFLLISYIILPWVEVPILAIRLKPKTDLIQFRNPILIVETWNKESWSIPKSRCILPNILKPESSPKSFFKWIAPRFPFRNSKVFWLTNAPKLMPSIAGALVPPAFSRPPPQKRMLFELTRTPTPFGPPNLWALSKDEQRDRSVDPSFQSIGSHRKNQPRLAHNYNLFPWWITPVSLLAPSLQQELGWWRLAQIPMNPNRCIHLHQWINRKAIRKISANRFDTQGCSTGESSTYADLTSLAKLVKTELFAP